MYTDPLVWDVSDRHLAMFAQLSYSTESIDQLKDYDNTFFLGLASVDEVDGWDLRYSTYFVNTLGEEEGFAANVYVHDKFVVFAFRGSSDDIDWNQNFASGINPFQLHPQTYEAEMFVTSAINTLGLDDSYRIFVTGHSLGGLLALHGTSELLTNDLAQSFVRTATFNGLGVETFAPLSIKERLEASSEKIAD